MTPTLTYDHLPDASLVARFRAGDEAAFRALHDRHRAPLLNFARRLLRASGHDADDVVQDAFIRAHAALRASDRPMALSAWLHTIVRNRALDALRAPQRATARLDEQRHRALLPDADPAVVTARRDEVHRLLADISALPERQRIALVQRELGGATHAEVAARLGTSVQGTKSLMIRARATLRARAA